MTGHHGGDAQWPVLDPGQQPRARMRGALVGLAAGLLVVLLLGWQAVSPVHASLLTTRACRSFVGLPRCENTARPGQASAVQGPVQPEAAPEQVTVYLVNSQAERAVFQRPYGNDPQTYLLIAGSPAERASADQTIEQFRTTHGPDRVQVIDLRDFGQMRRDHFEPRRWPPDSSVSR